MGAPVPQVYQNDKIAYNEYTKYLNTKQTELPLQNKVVIIFTNYRSGSNVNM